MKTTHTILIVDDDIDILEALKIYLSKDEYRLLTARNGQDAVDIVRAEPVDLVLMDIMMPIMDGIKATNKIRKLTNIPIILLTAKSEDQDKINGLDIGADDYITKPFNPSEVLARVNSQLRRYHQLGGVGTGVDKLVIGGIVLDDATKKVSVDGNEVSLTPMEFGILKMLMKQPGRVFTSSDIYKNVWNDEPIGSESVIAVHIRHLREKIEIDPSEPRYIKVVWGQGYKMEDSHERAQ